MPTLRPYQSKLDADIRAAWGAGAGVVLAVSPTGTGKTVTFSKVIQDEPGASCAIAHRKEIVSQISLALARNGVRHRIIGSAKTVTACQKLHMRKLRRHFIDPNSRCAVASVDTLIGERGRRENAAWFPQVRLWVGDEGHHFLRDNKWGKAVALFTNARGLLVTAETERADGKGLGRHADGLADALVLGPTMRAAIDMGYLTPYRVVTIKSDVDIASVEVSRTTGDFNLSQLRDAFHKAKAHCGSVVRAYQQFAAGKQAIVFSVDVETAGQTAAEFKAAGITAECISADTDPDVRDMLLARFEAKQIQVLTNVDLFGEGFDLPNIECVIMDRHTESFNLYKQQWGRGCRLDITPELMAVWDTFTDEQRRAHIAASAKPAMVLIDLVGNFVRHNGPPDQPHAQSLDRRSARAKRDPDAIPYRVCLNPDGTAPGVPCAKAYERFYKCCPFCGFYPEPPERSTPEVVEGDLTELAPDVLAALVAERERVDSAPVVWSDGAVGGAIRKRHYERQAAQVPLRRAMAWWAGYHDALGHTDQSEQYRRFWHAFDVDVATAMTLGVHEAGELTRRIATYLAEKGIDASVGIE